MGLNKEKPHLIIIPEDDKDRQLAVGFEFEVKNTKQIYIERNAGGWVRACEFFSQEYLSSMNRYPGRYVVLLIDFDERDSNRLADVQKMLPSGFEDRVFVIGSRKDPEQLKKKI
jgi:hypothetical protein